MVGVCFALGLVVTVVLGVFFRLTGIVIVPLCVVVIGLVCVGVGSEAVGRSGAAKAWIRRLGRST